MIKIFIVLIALTLGACAHIPGAIYRTDHPEDVIKATAEKRERARDDAEIAHIILELERRSNIYEI